VESGLRKSGGDSSIVGVTSSHAHNTPGIIAFANHLTSSIIQVVTCWKCILPKNFAMPDGKGGLVYGPYRRLGGKIGSGLFHAFLLFLKRYFRQPAASGHYLLPAVPILNRKPFFIFSVQRVFFFSARLQ
jgi:hypothetical protein